MDKNLTVIAITLATSEQARRKQPAGSCRAHPVEFRAETKILPLLDSEMKEMEAFRAMTLNGQ